MPGVKRPLHEDEQIEDDNVHPSRKRRLENGEPKAAYAKIFSPLFNGLGDHIKEKREEAVRDLLKTLATKCDDQRERLTYANTRLIKGTCSGAKASRYGFSVALAEVLRLASKGETRLPVANVINHINALTTLENKDEKEREYLLGRVWSYQAVLQSGILSDASGEDFEIVFDATAELACTKDWLRGECGAILHAFLTGPEAKDSHVKPLINSWCSKGIIKSPEGVALWLTARKQFPDVKLPKGHWHHSNPLHAQERPTLTSVLLKNAVVVEEENQASNTKEKYSKKNKAAGTRQVKPSFAWDVILAHLYEKDDGKDLPAFWEECVAKPMFSASSSAERKSLGLQLFSKAVASANAELLGDIVHGNIIRCIVGQRRGGDKSDNTLFAATKLPLAQMKTRANEDPWAAAELATKMLEVAPADMDKQTRLTIESLIASADEDNLVQVVKVLNELTLNPDDLEGGEADKKRRLLADVLSTTVRTRRGDPSQLFDKDDSPAQWLKLLLRSLTDIGFVDLGDKASPPMLESSRAVFQERLQTVLGHLASLPLKQAVRGPLLVVDRLHALRKSLATHPDEKSKEAIKDARKTLKDAEDRTSEADSPVIHYAFQLLLALGTLQVHLQQPDSVVVLEDITACSRSPADSEDASLMLVELLIKFASQQSALFRKLAEQVFTAFAPGVTAEGLHAMIDVLSHKETLAGQQELFGEEETEAGAGEGSDEDVDEKIVEDIEDASDMELGSDVELVNGGGDGSDDSEPSETDDNAAGEEELTEFERKLTEALGTEGMASDDDGSDMDDDEMEAVDEKLTDIFREQKLGGNKKQLSKDAQENVVNLKNRILDLLLVYVKSQHANPLSLDLLHPLVSLTRTSSSKPTAQKAFHVLETLFDTAKKRKSLPIVENYEDLFSILSAVHDELRLGGSSTHSTACSRASLFLAKLLTPAKSGENFQRIHLMYGELLNEYHTSGSKIPGSVFSDWHNWYMQK